MFALYDRLAVQEGLSGFFTTPEATMASFRFLPVRPVSSLFKPAITVCQGTINALQNIMIPMNSASPDRNTMFVQMLAHCVQKLALSVDLEWFRLFDGAQLFDSGDIFSHLCSLFRDHSLSFFVTRGHINNGEYILYSL